MYEYCNFYYKQIIIIIITMLKQDHCRGIYLPPSITGEEIPFQDIHNFSFSAKIQDDVFPLGTEYCCTTLWIKNLLEITLSLTILKIFSMFIFC